MKEDAFFEDVNSILNNGEVPNLFPPDEYMQLIDAVADDARRAGQGDSNASVFAFFVQRYSLLTAVPARLCLPWWRAKVSSEHPHRSIAVADR